MLTTRQRGVAARSAAGAGHSHMLIVLGVGARMGKGREGDCGIAEFVGEVD